MATFPILALYFSCLLIHIQPLNSNNWIGYTTEGDMPLILTLFQGTSYLLYPLCGWIAEVYLSNFKMIKWSFIVMLINTIVMLVTGLWLIVGQTFVSNFYIFSTVGTVIAIITGLIGFGMYESNAIQFGMDQMLEASSEQLSSFIQWYFWCVNIGPLVIYYVVICGYLVFAECMIKKDQLSNGTDQLLGWIFIILACFQMALSICGIILNFLGTRCFSVEESSKNSLKIIFKVLVYSFKHKYPERRSAFTYWENDVPSRIDLGKEKYGGPFTYEQVEDVKAMFRLLLLMVSLFGFHLSGDGYSLTTYIIRTMGCPTLLPSVTMIWNPQHVTVLVVVLVIPLYQVYRKYVSCHTPTCSLLNRLWWGLLLCLISECVQCNYSLFLEERDFRCLNLYLYNPLNPSLLSQCMAVHLKVFSNDSCENFCSTAPINSYLFYFSAIPLVMNGLSYLLVFVTTVEFICAQSPNAMKGLLIGIWYSMLFIRYSIVLNMDIHSFFLEVDKWNIYHGIKGLGVFLSIVLFSSVRKFYHYRERDEIVNEQSMIEEQYEKELLLREQEMLDNSEVKGEHS